MWTRNAILLAIVLEAIIQCTVLRRTDSLNVSIVYIYTVKLLITLKTACYAWLNVCFFVAMGECVPRIVNFKLFAYITLHRCFILYHFLGVFV